MSRAGSEGASRWIYGGVWRVLVDVFRVPREPPDLPAGSAEVVERFRPAEGYLRYLKLWFWIVLLLIDGVFLAIWLATLGVGAWLTIVTFPVFIAVAVLPDIFAYIAMHLRYDTMWYAMTDRSIRMRRGIWSITETTITFENVQNVAVKQGPVQRAFGIADVTIETAGGGGASGPHGAGGGAHVGLIQGVADAARIRDQIMARVRRSRSAGLGDDDSAGAESGGGAGGWTPAHLEALRDLRDAAAGLAEAAGGAGR